MIKIGLVYTATTPELIELVEKEIKERIPGEIQFFSYEDSSILQDTRENGFVTTQAANRLISLYNKAIKDGVDVILNCCSSVGEVADSVQNMAQFLGVPIVRIDEEMCFEAVRNFNKIGVLGTLSTTMDPTKNTLSKKGREIGKHPILIDGLIQGAFGLKPEEFKKCVLEKGVQVIEEVDALVFCQGSMAYCEEYISQKLKIPVYSSPKFGAIGLEKALIKIGKVRNE